MRVAAEIMGNDLSEHEQLQAVKRVRNGDANAFAPLVQAYRDPLFVFVGNMLRRGPQVGDVVQDVFLAAYANLASFDPSRSRFSTWLFSIAKNRCLNELRRKPLFVQADPDAAAPPYENSPEAAYFHRRLLEELDASLGAMPVKDRTVFIMAELNGLSHAEIAEVEGIGAGAVKSRLFRARARLKSVFAKQRNENHE